MTDFHSQSEHVARKDHLCDFCSTAIKKGERYSNSTGVFEGDFFVWKEHLDCRAAGLESMRLSGDYSYESMWNMDDEVRAWIKQDYPTIFERMADHEV
jgi:hypothetical protein